MQALVATAAVAVCLAVPAPVAAVAPDEPVVEWGGTTHSSRQSLETWLASHGLRYDVWASQHPIAALRLEQAEERAKRATASARPAVEGNVESALRPPILAAIGALGLALAVVALALSPAPVRFNPALRFVTDRRAYLALAGAGCLAAAAASYAVQL